MRIGVTGAFVFVILGAGGLGACGSGSGGGEGEERSLTLLEPDGNVTVGRGGTLRVELEVSGEEDATLSFVLDEDGDRSTASDAFPVKVSIADAGSPTEHIRVELTGVPPGSYRLMGQLSNANDPDVTATAPGSIRVRNVSFATRAGGRGLDRANGIDTFADGSSVVTGSFRFTTVFGEGEANETTLTEITFPDMFVARYNADGTLAWAKRGSSTGGNAGTDAVALDDGSSIVTGSFQDTVTFGHGESNETIIVPEGVFQSAFVARYNANGTLAWVRHTLGSGHNVSNAVAAFPDGSSVVTGDFRETVVFGPGEANETSLTATGTSSIFVARYDADGTLAWARRESGSDFDVGLGIAALAGGACVVTGVIRETVTFGSGEANETTFSAIGNGDVFVARYHANGTLDWVKRASGTGQDTGRGVTTYADGSIVVAGTFQEGVTFGPGELNQTSLTGEGLLDLFVARFRPDGALDWARKAGGSGINFGADVASIADGSAVVTGVFRESATFGAGESNETTLTADVGADLFVARYNTDGTLDWVRQVPGDADDDGRCIAAFPDGSCVVGGLFGDKSPVVSATATFGVGDANETVLTADRSGDIFVARFNADGDF